MGRDYRQKKKGQKDTNTGASSIPFSTFNHWNVGPDFWEKSLKALVGRLDAFGKM